MTNNDKARELLAAIRAEPVPKTMSDELTESQRRILIAFEAVQKSISEKQAADIINGVEKIIEKREANTRSFWRAVFDALWSMLSHGNVDLVVIDYGGMTIGASDTCTAQIRWVCEWAQEHPGKVVVLFTMFTAEIYAAELEDNFGGCDNIIARYCDPYSGERKKLANWLNAIDGSKPRLKRVQKVTNPL